MKKLLGIICLFMLLGTASAFSQAPSCSNDASVDARINALVNQGYTEINREWYQVAYLIAPTPPYLDGTLEVTLVGPYCGPACTPVMRVERWNAIVVNGNGNCVWRHNQD